jgi:aldose 1-epimerase
MTTTIPCAKDFDTNIDGKKVCLYVLKNKNGMHVAFTNYGGRIISILLPDKKGNIVDIIIGHESVDAFIKSTEPYFGAIIGRYGNRIAKGKFSIDGQTYTLATNNGVNHLHGGKIGYQFVVWNLDSVCENAISFSYLSKDSEEGYPGNLNVKVVYALTDENEFIIDYEATTDKKTVVNLTNHAFFNLNGRGEIVDHLLTIYADKYTPVDSTLIPIGNLELVDNTPFDFRKETSIGARINDANEQLKNGNGYDHNFVLNKEAAGKISLAAVAIGDKSGIKMEVFTEEPGLQFYSGNFMLSKNVLKRNVTDDFRTAFCLETQHFPDSPNQKNFPSTLLAPGEVYKTSSIYKFSINK